MLAWLRAFALTQVMEMPVYALAQRGRPWPRRLVVGFLASAITHPFVWFLFPALMPGREQYWTMVVLAETFALFAEAAWMSTNGVRYALWWSLAANATSFGTGVLFWQLDWL